MLRAFLHVHVQKRIHAFRLEKPSLATSAPEAFFLTPDFSSCLMLPSGLRGHALRASRSAVRSCAVRRDARRRAQASEAAVAHKSLSLIHI